MKEKEKPDLVIREEDKYKQEVELTFRRVFGYRLEAELSRSGHKKTPEERKAFTDRRLPVYLDALTRGSAALETVLEKGPLDIGIFEGQCIKRYTSGFEGLTWKIVPSSDDIMEKAIFFKKLRDHNFPQQGEADFWSDSLLVNWMLLEGFRQHDRIYSNFQNVRAIMSAVTIQYSHVLAYLTTPQLYFPDIERISLSLKKAAGKELDEKRFFIESFVISQDPVLKTLDKMSDLDRLGRSISAIHALLKNEDGTPLPSDHHRRPQFENTLCIELFANPRFFENKSRFNGRIETTLSRAIAVNEFMRKATAGLSTQDIQVTKGLIVHKFIEDHRQELANLFEEEQIPAELGIEYIQGLLAAKLKKLPDPDNESILRSSYILWYRPKDNPRSLPRRDEYAFTKGMVEKNTFYSKIFLTLTEEEQRDVLGEVLRRASMKKDNTYRQVIRKLLDVFDLPYEANEYKFTVNPHLLKTPGKSWIAHGQKLFLEVCLSRLQQRDAEIADNLERIMQESAFSLFLKNLDTPADLSHFSQRVSSAKEHLRTGKQIGKESKESFEWLVDSTSRLALIIFFGKPIPMNYNIRLDIQHAIEVARQHMDTEEEKVLKTTEDQSGFYQAVVSAVNKTIADFQKSYFPADYPQNKLPFLIKVIQDSLL